MTTTNSLKPRARSRVPSQARRPGAPRGPAVSPIAGMRPGERGVLSCEREHLDDDRVDVLEEECLRPSTEGERARCVEAPPVRP